MSPTNLVQELDRIADRVATLARVVHGLREENQSLKTAVDQRDGENRLLRDRLDEARKRVEVLIGRMPADES